jgi:hypothetical protein|tara:strand:+ start:208 stop:339 length:132 start_codon:yes stop_codon:yes gene_type:complete
MFKAIGMTINENDKTELKKYLELALSIFLVIYFGSMAIDKIRK